MPYRVAEDVDEHDAAEVTAGAVAKMGRQMPEVDLRALLYANYEHPRWDDVAERCLTCGNCTMVCPTCFCTSVEDTADLAGEEAERYAPVGVVFLALVYPCHRRRRRASRRARAIASG